MADTDHKRMLEMAAKAMGWTQAEFQDMRGWGEVRHGFSEAMWVPEIGEYWNPLADDGDALRLAVKLHMLLDADGEYYTVSTATPKGTGVHAYEKHKQDPYAATRRAIVRAAAAIGEKMP